MSLIEVRNLKKSYPLGDINLNILKGINVNIENGEFVAIMGPSGSGKSTFMNILGCLDKPSSGKYILDGVDIGKLSPDKLAEIRNRKIGFVFQGFNLLSRTSSIENVELPMIYAGVPAEERQARAKKALEKVGLRERMHHQPSQLSGGQQQRVAIARAIVNEAPIIFADEPTGNLDSKSGKVVAEEFRKINEELGKTLLMVTHDPQMASWCKRVIFLKDGYVMNDVRKEGTEEEFYRTIIGEMEKF